MADDLEEYDMEQDKFMPGKGGKGRSKLEASTHTNHHDPGGQTRKIVTKMQNTEKNRAEAGGEKGPAQKKAPAQPQEWYPFMATLQAKSNCEELSHSLILTSQF